MCSDSQFAKLPALTQQQYGILKRVREGVEEDRIAVVEAQPAVPCKYWWTPCGVLGPRVQARGLASNDTPRLTRATYAVRAKPLYRWIKPV